MREFEPLLEDAIVYRSILRKQWINEDTGKVKADAYFLRANEIGLSVNLASECSPEQCAENFRQCYGVASLEVVSVREIGLNVEQDKVNLNSRSPALYRFGERREECVRVEDSSAYKIQRRSQ